MEVQATLRLRVVFTTSFNAFRKHVVAFTILCAIAHIPLFLWFFALNNFPRWAVLLDMEVVSVVVFVCMIIAYGAIIYEVLQDLAGRPAPQIADTPRLMQPSLRSRDWIVESIPKAIAIATRRLMPLVGVLLAAVVLIRLVVRLPAVLPGFPIFIVPWMYWLVVGVYFVAAPICIAERVGVGAALSRCRFLTRGHRGQIFSTILLVGIFDFAIRIIWDRAVAPHAPVGAGAAGLILNYTVLAGIGVAIGAFNAVIAAVFYDRLRSIKDGAHMARLSD
jgi:hypothetical protein